MSGMRKFSIARQGARSAPAATATPAAAAAPLPSPSDPIASAMDQAAFDVPRLLTPKAVAEMLGVTERTLERWRITGEGPRFAKLSRSSVRYQPDDIAAFVSDRLRANTAQ